MSTRAIDRVATRLAHRFAGRRALAWLAALLLATSCSETVPSGRIVVEADSPATRGDRLLESIAIETSAGQLAPILEQGCALPCRETVTFATAEEAQTEIAVYLFRGNGPTTDGATALGAYRIHGFPLASGIEVEVALTFHADAAGISLEVDPGPAGEIVVEAIEVEEP